MNAQHTPGRIAFRPNGDANSYALLDDKGNWWLNLLMNGEQITEHQIENLRRLAACWNACEGIATAAIEHDGPGGVARSMREATRQLLTLRTAVEIAARNAESRLHMLPLKVDFVTRESLETELRVYRQTLDDTQPFVAAVTDTSGRGWR